MTVVNLREASEADREAILALRARVFEDVDPEKLDPRFWNWEFRDGPAGPARVYVAEIDGGVRAHFALVPLPWSAGGESLAGALAVDAMTDASARRHGLFTRLVGHALEKAGFPFVVAWQIRGAVLGPMTRNGFEPVATAPVLVRPLSLRAIARRAGLPLARRPARSERPEALTAGAAPAMAALAEAFLPPGRVHGERAADAIRWRVFAHPAAGYEVTGDPERAWLVTRRTVLRGVPALAIVDLAWGEDRRADAVALVRAALARAAADDLDVAAALVTRFHPAFALLLRLGFLPGPHRFRLLLRAGPALRPRLQEWALSWIDTDHL